jgi:uncharacterized membrane protein YjgN (DUF898 family)
VGAIRNNQSNKNLHGVSMSSPQFEVVLKGVLAGFDEAQAKTDFSALFSLDADKAARLFAAKRAVLKSGVTQDVANKYVARLASIGVEATAEVIITEQPLSVEPNASELFEAEASAPAEVSLQVSEPAATESYRTDAADPQQKHRHGFVFSGAGVEYFKIWIVNILLSIVTLGIYSAWAKVRNKQYFYGNTHIADATFEYTAEPIKILKGRIIAFVLYVALIFSGHISPILSLVVTVLFFIFLPWIIVNSLKFNARHTSYRNIPFRFHGTIGGALKVFIGWPILGMLSLGLLFPFAWKKQTEYINNNHSYGVEPFNFTVHVKEYYKMLLILIGASVVFMILFAVLLGGSVFAMITAGKTFDPRAILAMVPMILGYMAFYFALGSYVVVTMANIHWNNTKLQHHQFESNWSVLSYMGLIVTNTLGILCTLGLFIPFAKVRAAAYKTSHTTLIVAGDLNGFIANTLEDSNSLGEGVHDLFDIDISI